MHYLNVMMSEQGCLDQNMAKYGVVSGPQVCLQLSVATVGGKATICHNMIPMVHNMMQMYADAVVINVAMEKRMNQLVTRRTNQKQN